ncbi:hypothetical protein NKR19_g370 [Coniochaeta hoffmannii]|uniref:ABM domain-containing protein n=1 Tax=Coniochaeta hoffmannii TaxID=91930 RepID=A0AA38S0P9_9PEZI|nr:hypothetical protein NKR19_g370 [Coniochaeta hoffmannii]
MTIIDLTAVLTLNPGKLQRVLEEFDRISKFVKANEPGVLRYELTRGIPEKNGGADIVVIREIYASEAAQQSHLETPACQHFIKCMEGEKFCADAKIVFTQPKVTFGFTSRL